jgi:hypothetical protein
VAKLRHPCGITDIEMLGTFALLSGSRSTRNQPPSESADLWDKVRVTGVILDLGDDPTSDHRRVGVPPDFSDVLRRRHAEADRNRKIGETTNSLNKASRGIR